MRREVVFRHTPFGLLSCFSLFSLLDSTNSIAFAHPSDASRRLSPSTPASGCTRAKCHQGIEDIVDRTSSMGRALASRARQLGDAEGCTVCHGGTTHAKQKEQAHRSAPAPSTEMSSPDSFFPDPGSPWVNSRSCGPCHDRHVKAQWRSPMMTGAGEAHGAIWAFGAPKGYEHRWANYPVRNPGPGTKRSGSSAYQRYMKTRSAAMATLFPQRLAGLPGAPQSSGELKGRWVRAAHIALRARCQRCHLGVKGRAARGDHRAMGCSACHIPYGNEGRYEGGDKAIKRGERGHALVHRLQGTRRSSVEVNGVTYRGIPIETCTSCHSRGKRVGVSFQGLMETSSPRGDRQPLLHGERYIALRKDVHQARGLACQDCHTSNDVHGDGFLAGSTLAQVEIECSDCHGTPSAFPWELPLGYGEELARKKGSPVARGSSRHEGGKARHLLSARGNVLPNVTRRGDDVMVRSASGRNILLEPLKARLARGRLSGRGRLAMSQIERHLSRLECYACHATWASQRYGMHLLLDYSKGARSFDWLAAGRRHEQAKAQHARGERRFETRLAGTLSVDHAYRRWEEPALVRNDEGRVSPAAPLLQVSLSVKDENGEFVLRDHLFRNWRKELCIDTSPLQPHTSGAARPCSTCHQSTKALGHGHAASELQVTTSDAPKEPKGTTQLQDGKLSAKRASEISVTHPPLKGQRCAACHLWARPGAHGLTQRWDEALKVDLMTVNGKSLSRHARVQRRPLRGLKNDWSRFVREDGKQLMTVGSQSPRSAALDNGERRRMRRDVLCESCHREMPDGSVAIRALGAIAAATDQRATTPLRHDAMTHKVVLVAAWAQVGAGILLGLMMAAGATLLLRRHRQRRNTSTQGSSPIKDSKWSAP